MRQVAAWILAAGLAAMMAPASGARAQGSASAPRVITQQIDESARVPLSGDTRPEIGTAIDHGAVPDAYPMPHMLLQLKRSSASEQAFAQTIEALHDPASPQFHQWLDPADIGARFGLSSADLSVIAGWLAGYRFNVNVVYDNGLLIDFSGTAGQVRRAFHTEIHSLDVGGAPHIANIGDPEIPAALAPAIEGIVALHDFKPHPMMKKRPAYTFCSGACQAVVPADLATIYNLTPAFAAGLTGKGETVVVIEDTNVFKPADWTTFRKTFGLDVYASGKFVEVHPAPPSGATNCTNPGVNGDESEAILDAEWASAAAPNATIELASCADSPDGLLIALQNLIAAKTHPSIISMSYGECEAANGAASNAAYNRVFQQAVAEGVSVFVSAGDEDAASCDAGLAAATHGIGVSGLGSTIYNVAVGGTDFADTDNNDSSKYWSSTNKSNFGSAKSYIPEIPWNGSCGSELLAKFNGFSESFGPSGFCNSSVAVNEFLEVVGGSGGPSGCATGAPSVAEVVSGTCKGYAKPSWQKLVGNPNDGVRDIPDVSLFASNGIWNEYYVYCDSDVSDGGAPCSGAPSGWSGAGGTSFSSPILAGIQALVNQHMGKPQGNPNPVYYKLANAEYGAKGDPSCESDGTTAPVSTCVFYNVYRGDMDVNCMGSHDCFLDKATNGVLSKSDSSFAIAYGAGVGWNFATGIGTVNVHNLIMKWSSALTATTAAAQ